MQRSFRSLRKQSIFHDATAGFPTKWCLSNDCGNSILITHQCFWLAEANFPCDMTNQISATHISIVTHHQCGISVHVSQRSFCRETSGCIVKCWLFCQENWHHYIFFFKIWTGLGQRKRGRVNLKGIYCRIVLMEDKLKSFTLRQRLIKEI